MTAIIVQEQEGATAQNLAGAANYATWQKATAIHWFSMAIQEEDWHRRFAVLCGWFPQARRPGCQRIRQPFSAARLGYLAQKPFCVSITEGARSPSEECQPCPGVATQVPGALESHGPKEEQREQEPTTARAGTVRQAGGRQRLTHRYRTL
jgi:hypothetical protein